eukprot:1157935-Pelagomonas_calceolata.AAC.7
MEAVKAVPVLFSRKKKKFNGKWLLAPSSLKFLICAHLSIQEGEGGAGSLKCAMGFGFGAQPQFRASGIRQWEQGVAKEANAGM